MKIIAHRGFWHNVKEKNTLFAFQRAVGERFGIETDFRDSFGRLVVSHNPPQCECLLGKDFFALCKGGDTDVVFALNIKADGLQAMFKNLKGLIHGIKYFFFDMSVPDALDYLDAGFVVFTRQSEWEMSPSFYQEAHGIWIDPFKDDAWVDHMLIAEHLEAGKQVCLVSPELHGNNYQKLWGRLAKLPADIASSIMLCTDFPNEARSFFCKND